MLRDDVKGQFTLAGLVLLSGDTRIRLENTAKVSLVVKSGLVGYLGKRTVVAMHEGDCVQKFLVADQFLGRQAKMIVNDSTNTKMKL